jgi:hypothetical protein
VRNIGKETPVEEKLMLAQVEDVREGGFEAETRDAAKDRNGSTTPKGTYASASCLLGVGLTSFC